MRKRLIIVGMLATCCGMGAYLVSAQDHGQKAGPQQVSGTIAKPIDLGLSVRWANHNLGALVPEDYGGQYGWGDPTGLKTSTSNSDYPSDDPPTEISGTELDIAHVQWKGGWRLPTRTEQKELLARATWKAMAVNGIEGYRVTGPNGNSIFLPASGGRVGDQINYRVVGGDYWSGTLSSKPGEAYYMYFYQGRQQSDDIHRHYGFSVRPVIK